MHTDDRTTTMIIAVFGPPMAALLMGVGTGVCVSLLSPDSRIVAIWALTGGWSVYLLTYGLLSDMAARPVVEREQPEPMPAVVTEYPELERLRYHSPGGPLMATVEDSANRLSRHLVYPPLPIFADIETMRRMAWGLARANRPLSGWREWCQGPGHLLVRDSEYFPVIRDMVARGNAKKIGNKTILTDQGRVWCERIIHAYGVSQTDCPPHRK